MENNTEKVTNSQAAEVNTEASKEDKYQAETEEIIKQTEEKINILNRLQTQEEELTKLKEELAITQKQLKEATDPDKWSNIFSTVLHKENSKAFKESMKEEQPGIKTNDISQFVMDHINKLDNI